MLPFFASLQMSFSGHASTEASFSIPFPCLPCPTTPAEAPCTYTIAGYKEGTTIDAAVIPHGSFIELEAVKAAQAPVLFLFSHDEDKQIPGPLRKQIQSVLDSKPGFAGKHYPNQEHGWCAHAPLIACLLPLPCACKPWDGCAMAGIDACR